jgi:predicted RNA-binding protein with PIN domain
MSGHLIVDGYNLARSGGLPLEGDPGSAEERDSLCSLLSVYARRKGLRLTVVFDARGAGNPERSRTAFKGGTAVFSSGRETADDVIRDFSRGAASGTVVVTSDRGLAGTLPSRNVAVISSDEFAARLFDDWVADIKGGTGEEKDRPSGRGGRKKGEGHRPKKQERKREQRLRKL